MTVSAHTGLRLTHTSKLRVLALKGQPSSVSEEGCGTDFYLASIYRMPTVCLAAFLGIVYLLSEVGTVVSSLQMRKMRPN